MDHHRQIQTLVNDLNLCQITELNSLHPIITFLPLNVSLFYLVWSPPFPSNISLLHILSHLFKLISCHPPPIPSPFMVDVWIFLYLQPLGQEEQPRTLEPARSDLPVQGDSFPLKHRRAAKVCSSQTPLPGKYAGKKWRRENLTAVTSLETGQDSPAKVMSDQHGRIPGFLYI